MKSFVILSSTFLLAIIQNSFSFPAISSITLNGKAQTGGSPDSVHKYVTNSMSPGIITFSVSPGAQVYLKVTASGRPPVSFQWQLNGTELSGENQSTYGFPGALLAAGDYTVVVTDADTSLTSPVATLELDPTFTKVMTDPVVTNLDFPTGGTWGDFDNDGYLDLLTWNGQDNSSLGHYGYPSLYRNNHDGTFTRTNVLPSNVYVYSTSGAWGDYDNDGNLDLYVTLPVNTVMVGTNLLFHNNGDGTFTNIQTGSLVTDRANTYGAAWADYDQDGFLDLFVTTLDANANSACFLYRNNGDGTFNSDTNSALVKDLASSSGCVWGDYDNDGKIDLFVCGGGASFSTVNRLYHNNGDGSFTRMTNPSIGSIVTDNGVCKNAAWGDYDNDGFLDLFVSNGSGGNNFLYHNNGNGTFNRVNSDIVATDPGKNFVCGAWGDYDNDGFLDLFVTDEGNSLVVNRLYHNNGDGTFTKIGPGNTPGGGSPANEYSDCLGACWIDYDNDGFLDLYASRGDQRGSYLYHNNLPNTGNTNGWLTVRLVGTVSNRSAIGAKIRIKAFYRGQSHWQMRQITGGTGTSGHNELQANFGLGDATNVDTVRIEWPSGTVQELHDVAPRQLLTIAEPPRLLANAFNGVPQFALKGGRFMQYDVQGSTNLEAWSLVGVVTITNVTGTAQIVDTNAPASNRRFYRAVSH